MSSVRGGVQRLQFLIRVTSKQASHLAATSERLFDVPFTAARAVELEGTPELAERLDAFVSRFGRLQDTLGDKLLPALLSALDETPSAAIDDLDRAERLGLILSADQWMEIRRLRNQMIHGYIEDPTVLADALEAAHRYVPTLLEVSVRLSTEIRRRGWA